MNKSRWAVVVVGLVFLSVSAWALAAQKGKARKPKTTLDHFTAQLRLTSDQRARLKPEADKFDATMEDLRHRMNVANDGFVAALAKVLTPEQKQLLQEKAVRELLQKKR